MVSARVVISAPYRCIVVNRFNFIDIAIEKGIIFLLIFTPLAFGTVQPWSVALMEITAFSLFCLYIPRFRADGPRFLTNLLILFMALIAVILFQMLPLPALLLNIISPASLETYRQFLNNPEGTFYPVSINPYATRQELLKLLAYAAVFFVIVSHYRTKEQVNSLVWTILYMGCFLVVFAIVQKMTWNGRIFWIYPVDESLRDGLRIRGPYISYDNFAGYMEMAIPLGMGLLLYLVPSVKALPESPLGLKMARFLASEKLVPYALLFLLVLMMVAALFMTFSRGGILAFIFSSLFFAWITYRRRTLRRKTGLLAILAAVIFAAVVQASWDRLEQRFADLKQDHVSRLSVWQDSLGIVRDYPVLGTGLGTFENAYMRYQTTMPRLLFDHAHNDYVELVTDTGVVGFLLSAGMALVFFPNVFRRWKRKRGMFGKCLGAGGLSACAAIAVHSFTDFNLHIPANALLFTIISAVTCVAIFHVSSSSATASAPPSAPIAKPLLIYALLPVIFILLSFPVRDLAADYYYQRTAHILDDQTTEGLDVMPISASSMPAYLAAIVSLKKATLFAPSHSLYQKALADMYSRLGEWAQTMESLRAPLPAGALSNKEAWDHAIACLQKAVLLNPTNPDYHLAIGLLYDKAGRDPRMADKELKRAADAYPLSVPLRYVLAMNYLLSGRKGDALEQARVTATIDDSYIISDSIRKNDTIERRPPGYLSMLSRSYLFGALEIAWRVSKDPEVVKGITPDTPDAAPVLQLFMETRNIGA